ncbi:MAG: response regulator transcription factor [Phycisphaerae bacterium]|nr:response regulator transcription factor [Phycisphaerae bacterium]
MTTGTIDVLLADDHRMVREGLATLLRRESDIRVVGECGDGLRVAEEVRRTEPDVAVLDIMMPRLNGLDACRELRRRDGSLAILILTMYDDEQFIARAFDYGASGYLLKEAVGQRLAEAVRAVARGEIYLGPGIPRDVVQRARDGESDPYEKLTTRERQVLHLIAEGKTNRQIAEELKLALKTIDTHRSHLMRKLDIHDQTNLVKFAIRRGLVSAR